MAKSVLKSARGLLHSTSHMGSALAVARRFGRRSRPLSKALSYVERWMERYTDYRTRAFDREHATDTYERVPLSRLDVGGSLEPDFGQWMYGPINQDFFREMLDALPVRLQDFGFWDVGAGKALALMLASEYPFRELVGVEFSAQLVAAGKANVAIFERSTGRRVAVTWVCQDFMTYALPSRPALFFLNSPFPAPIAERAIRHIEASLAEHPRRAIVLYRKPPRETVALMDASRELRFLIGTPYWRAYESRAPGG